VTVLQFNNCSFYTGCLRLLITLYFVSDFYLSIFYLNCALIVNCALIALSSDRYNQLKINSCTEMFMTVIVGTFS